MRRHVFNPICCRKRPSQRLFKRDQRWLCGARQHRGCWWLSILLYLAGLPFRIPVFWGIRRWNGSIHRHSWVHKADLPPRSGRSSNHVAVAELLRGAGFLPRL